MIYLYQTLVQKPRDMVKEVKLKVLVVTRSKLNSYFMHCNAAVKADWRASEIFKL